MFTLGAPGYSAPVPDSSDTDDRIVLALDSSLTNAAVARRELGEFADSKGFDDEAVQAARVIVTEAFTNAASHAYRGGDGQIEVEAVCEAEGLRIVVRDYGEGIRPSPVASSGTHGRLGLLMIAALAELCQIRRLKPRGTELTAVIAAPQRKPAGRGRFAGSFERRSLVA